MYSLENLLNGGQIKECLTLEESYLQAHGSCFTLLIDLQFQRTWMIHGSTCTLSKINVSLTVTSCNTYCKRQTENGSPPWEKKIFSCSEIKFLYVKQTVISYCGSKKFTGHNKIEFAMRPSSSVEDSFLASTSPYPSNWTKSERLCSMEGYYSIISVHVRTAAFRSTVVILI